MKSAFLILCCLICFIPSAVSAGAWNEIEKAANLGLNLKKPLFETANEIGMQKIVNELKKLSEQYGAFYEPDPLLLSMC